MRGIVIGGTHSGCGKTTVTLGVLAALKARGIRVQSFKAGPDYIDTGLHGVITGRPSRNLDLWMCGESYVKECLETYSFDADFVVVEGVMGLFDGDFSTASLAAELGLPVALVIDGYGMAETSAAFARGFKEHAAEKGVAIKGIIFNRVASPEHFRRLAAATPQIPVWGYLPRDLEFEIPHRHLGLAVAEENPMKAGQIDRLGEVVERFIDLDALLESEVTADFGRIEQPGVESLQERDSCCIAVAYDRAFNFYYEDNLDLLKRAGAEIVRFSPLTDRAIPDGADALYIGGGYPEVHAAELSRNRAMRKAVKDWAMAGRPIYAECGGLMYLSEGIYDFEGDFHEMAGIFPFKTRMKSGRSRLGYRRVAFIEDCIIGRKGETARGHEFHYSEIVDEGAAPGFLKVYSVENASGEPAASGGEGFICLNTLASYIHLHFGSNPRIAEVFIENARKRGR
ncbi:MAG TPA: cobyrinate a,c-diamide synthase [Syntrophorhabdaceae bacterium]|jgi:cobyrinic acid a,c-diamide synthase